MELASRLRLVLEQDLRLCLDGNQFMLVIQPKVSLATGNVMVAEALIRWAHPTRGLVSPGTFLQLAREIGVMPSIDAWVLRQAVIVCQGLHSAGLQIPLSINLSGDALGDDALPERLGRQLVAAGVPASMLEVEIPEGDLMSDAQASTRTLQALHAMGIRLSIDDFGTGYSSFAYLAQFPVHTLKIDRSFVTDLTGHASEIPRKIVRSIVRLSHSLGLGVVAEGAETDAQLVALRKLKCDAVQGFAVSRPLCLKDFRDFCSTRIVHNTAPNPLTL
jgi:EAL domain-containing protein (putative c-di-GMP-specific phosphodiesterase class I)